MGGWSARVSGRTALAKVATETADHSDEQPQPSCSSSLTTVRAPRNYSRQSTEPAEWSADELFSFEEFLQLDPDSVDTSRSSSKGITNPGFGCQTTHRHQQLVGTYHRDLVAGAVNFYVLDGQRQTAISFSDLDSSRRRGPLSGDRTQAANAPHSGLNPHPIRTTDRLHPVLRFGLGYCFCKAICGEWTFDSDQVERMGTRCWQIFRQIIPGRRSNPAARYTVAEPSEPIPSVAHPSNNKIGFSVRERPKLEDIVFKGIHDNVAVRRYGDIRGEQFIIENCKNSVLLVLDALSAVTIDDCHNCVIVLGPCKGSIFVRDCHNCTIFACSQQFRTRDCTLMVHLFCTTKPIVEDSKVDVFPLHLKYPFIQENMTESGMSPFLNKWASVHDFTPQNTELRVHDTVRPLESVYGPDSDWVHHLGREQISTAEADSFFVSLPSKVLLNENETSTLLLFNLCPKVAPARRRSFYEVCREVTHRLQSPPSAARILSTFDIDLKDGELGNVLGQPKLKTSGKLVAVKVAMSKRIDNLDTLLAGLDLSGITVQLVSTEQTGAYHTALRRLSALQSNI